METIKNLKSRIHAFLITQPTSWQLFGLLAINCIIIGLAAVN